MTPLNMKCQTKSVVTGKQTSPNKVAGEVIFLILSFLLDKNKTGGIIHKEVHNNNNEFQISRAIN